MDFQIKEKLMLRIFSTQEVGTKKKLVRCFTKWEIYISALKKKLQDIFFSMEYPLLIAKESLF